MRPRAARPRLAVALGLAALGLALVAVPGCRRPKGPPPPSLVEVRVVDRGGDDGDGTAPRLDLGALTQVARTAIVASSGVPLREDAAAAPSSDGGVHYRLRVEVAIGSAEDPARKQGNLRALVRARLAPVAAAPGALEFEQSAVADKAYALDGKPAPAWQPHAERAVRDLVNVVGARLKLSAGPSAALVAAIDGSDDDLRDEAVRLAAERRDAAAVPALVKLLKSDDHAVRDRAIGALAAVGDARAVHPLTEVARFHDLGDLPKVLDALATIGGPEARAYLEFVASGHESQEMRELAKQALGHLDRRAGEAKTAAADSRP